MASRGGGHGGNFRRRRLRSHPIEDPSTHPDSNPHPMDPTSCQTFELVEVRESELYMNEEGHSMPPQSTEVDPSTTPAFDGTGPSSHTPASSSASTPTPRGQTNQNDYTVDLPLSADYRQILDGWVRDLYRDYRSRVCTEYYDRFETDAERLANKPNRWPPNQWAYVVEYWGTDKYKAKRETGKAAKAHQKMKHTGGSASYQSKRFNKIKETGRPVDNVGFFIDMHTSKKTKTYIDEESRNAAEMMQEIVRSSTSESSPCNLSSMEIVNEVLGPASKGRERLQGRVAPRGRTRLTIAEVDRRVREDSARAIAVAVREANKTYNERIVDLERQHQEMEARRVQELADADARRVRELAEAESRRAQELEEAITRTVMRFAGVTMTRPPHDQGDDQSGQS